MIMSNDIDALGDALYELPLRDPPEPWKKSGTFAIGGLLAVGYAAQSDYLLVVSSQGRGVFDCVSGEKVARDTDDVYKYCDDIRLQAIGIGPIAEQTVHIAGITGGGLTKVTQDGWKLQLLPLNWPDEYIFLEYPHKSLYNGPENCVKVGTNGACELRAYGFSETGLSFVIALSCEIVLFTRA
jgi:hypothetical protein